jgi:anti-sigma factor RsiW
VNCHQALPLVAPYVDGEMDRLQRLSIEKHFRACAACSAERESLSALHSRFRAEVPYFAAPPALRTRIATVVRVTPAVAAPSARREGNRWRWLSVGALAGCVATVLAWFVGSTILDLRSNDDLASEAVASHVRATLGHHLVEIASSDQHTVKPWLSARLDYSPPVRDFASEGFPLVGGRLDSLDRRPVAVLVYRYRQHTIDVFVRPVSRARLAPRTLRGFNVVQATGADMDWIAVSDVSADVLSSFVTRLATGSAGP